jgi:hypothetical protein
MTTERTPAKRNRRPRLFLGVLLASAVLVLSPLPQARAQLLPGDSLATDWGGPTRSLESTRPPAPASYSATLAMPPRDQGDPNLLVWRWRPPARSWSQSV